MCGSMIDIPSATAEIRRGKKKKKEERKKKPPDENIMACPALLHRAAIKRCWNKNVKMSKTSKT